MDIGDIKIGDIVMNDLKTKRDIFDTFKVITSSIVELRKRITAQLSLISARSDSNIKSVNDKIDFIGTTIKNIKLKEGIPGKDADPDLVAQSLKDDNDFISGLKGDDADIDEIIDRLEQDLPRFGSQFRDGLELLKGEERLDVSAIKGLEEWFEKVEKFIASGRSGNVISASGRGHIKTYDLSVQLDGVKTTFNLPANWTVISVSASSFPGALRPVIDYTWTMTTISFTSQIEAVSTLASGQTIVVIYEEA